MGFKKDVYIMLMWMAKSENLRVFIFSGSDHLERKPFKIL